MPGISDVKGSSARRLALLVLTSVLFSAFLCEMAVRILGFGGMVEYEPNAAWGYLMRPAQRVYVYGHPVVINSEGLRGPEIAATKADREARIVFFGDSITYGGGRIREEELFVRHVERFLLENEVPSEVLNVSAPGWSPQNWIRFVQRRGLYEADVAVAVIPEADLRRPFSTMEMHSFRQKTPPLQLGWFLLKLQLMIRGPDTDLWKDVDPAVEAKRNVDAVRELLAIAERSGAALIVVLVPSRAPRIDGSYWPPRPGAAWRPPR